MAICHFCIQEYKRNLRRQIKNLLLEDNHAQRPGQKVRIFVKLKQKRHPIEMTYTTHHGLHATIRREVNEKVTSRWAFFDIETINWELAG
jgi:hypothetical protein